MVRIHGQPIALDAGSALADTPGLPDEAGHAALVVLFAAVLLAALVRALLHRTGPWRRLHSAHYRAFCAAARAHLALPRKKTQ
jgi:hypothetical protein